MNLGEAAFLTDENIHADVVAYLRAEGHDVLDVQEEGLFGSPDLLLIHKAFAEQRVILTHDSDFGTLAVANGASLFGLVYLRPGHIRSEFTIGTLHALFDQQLDLTPPFLVVAKRMGNTVHIRIRAL